MKLICTKFDHSKFKEKISGKEHCFEGGKRCEDCFRLRLEETAKFAKKKGYDFFATTLTVSPHKNSELINKIGKEVAKRFEIEYLPSNFKKNNGFVNGIKLAKRVGFVFTKILRL